MKVLPNIFRILSFVFSVAFLFLSFTSSQPVLAQQQCYVFQDEFSRCTPPGGNGNSCPGGQYYCPGYTNSDRTGQTCWACVSSPTQEKLSCSTNPEPARSDGKNCEQLGYTIVGNDCGDGPGGAQCSGTYIDGCKYCAAMICSPGTVPYSGVCVPVISCEVYDAIGTGTTTGEAKSKVSQNSPSPGTYYDTVEWALVNTNDGSRTVAGYTQLSNGNSSNGFTNLQQSTTYTVEATYQSGSNSAPDVSCSPASFTTWSSAQQPTQTTCSLTADPQSINIGDYSTWTLSSTNEPSGSQAYWHGSVEGRITAPDYVETVLYNTSGSDSRWVEIRDSSGTVQCTTDTIQVYVNPSNYNHL